MCDFDSLAPPYPSLNYISYDLASSTFSVLFPQYLFQGRYVSTPEAGALVQCRSNGTNIFTLNRYDQLVNMTVVWIAGNGTNGGDRPDVHTYLPTIPLNYTYVHNNVTYTYDLLYPRMEENFDIIFYNNSIYPPIDLFNISNHDVGQPLWPVGGTPNPYVYPNNVFSVTTIRRLTSTTTAVETSNSGSATSNVYQNWNWNGVTGIRFVQPRHTWLWDNYAIKYIEMTFKYDISQPSPAPPPPPPPPPSPPPPPFHPEIRWVVLSTATLIGVFPLTLWVVVVQLDRTRSLSSS